MVLSRYLRVGRGGGGHEKSIRSDLKPEPPVYEVGILQLIEKFGPTLCYLIVCGIHFGMYKEYHDV
jgi:hypothetical protein